MSSPDRIRRAALLALPLMLPLVAAGCGFTPAAGPGGIFGRVRADDPTDRAGFDFVGRIERRLGAPRSPDFALAYRLTLEQDGVAGASAASTTRFQIRGRVDYVLRSATTSAILTQGTDSGFTGYSSTSTTIAEAAAQSDARTRLVNTLADQVAARLIATHPMWST